MVFGFGKKKSAEAPTAPPPSHREVALHEIPSLIKEIEAPRITNIIREAKHLKQEIESNRKNIYDIILQLESDDLKLDDVDKNLRTLGKRGKDAVVSTIKKETKAELSGIENYEDVLELNNEVTQVLKRMGDILGLHTRVLHVFARKYADKLKDEITEIAQNRNSLQRLISEEEKFRSDTSSIQDSIKKIHETEQEKGKRAHRANEMVTERNELTRTIIRLEQEINEMRSSPEYTQFIEVKKKIDDLSTEKAEIREKVGAQFSKISRPLNKYSYVSSFDKPMKKIMQELIADPYQVISSENKVPIIEILQAVTKSVVAGNVSVKDSDRSADLVEETIERLDEFLRLKSEHTKKVSELETRLGIFDPKKLDEKEAGLEKARTGLKILEMSHEKLEKEISQDQSQLGSLKRDLEERLSKISNQQIVARMQG